MDDDLARRHADWCRQIQERLDPGEQLRDAYWVLRIVVQPPRKSFIDEVIDDTWLGMVTAVFEEPTRPDRRSVLHGPPGSMAAELDTLTLQKASVLLAVSDRRVLVLERPYRVPKNLVEPDGSLLRRQAADRINRLHAGWRRFMDDYDMDRVELLWHIPRGHVRLHTAPLPKSSHVRMILAFPDGTWVVLGRLEPHLAPRLVAAATS